MKNCKSTKNIITKKRKGFQIKIVPPLRKKNCIKRNKAPNREKYKTRIYNSNQIKRAKKKRKRNRKNKIIRKSKEKKKNENKKEERMLMFGIAFSSKSMLICWQSRMN